MKRALVLSVLAAAVMSTVAAGQLAGGTIVQRGKLTLAEFPGIDVILQPQEPGGGTVGTVLNHFGFHVRDFEPSVAQPGQGLIP
ncbi:MAG TPA: hypothetical protein VH417_18925 [Vicinamibacterales bacterium]